MNAAKWIAVSISAIVVVSLVGFAVATTLPSRSPASPPPYPSHIHGRHALSYHKIWSARLDANADSTAVVAPKVGFPDGTTKMVVVVEAGNNGSDCDPGNPVNPATTYAFNGANGHLLWKASTAGAGRCTTAAPTIADGFVYSAGLDGSIHKYSLTSGDEVTSGGWPIPFTNMPDVEKASANLIVHASYLYLTTSGFVGDGGHYEGHVVTVDLGSGHVNVWNSLCSNVHRLLSPDPFNPYYCPSVQAGMFGRGQAALDPISHDVYVVTGNGPWNGKTNWGDSVLKLSADGSKLVDAFTPSNQAYLNDSDSDLGSTGADVLPPITDRGHLYQLLVQGGKGGSGSNGGPAVLWLVNRDRMGARSGPGSLGGQFQHIQSPGGCEVLRAPAVWKDRQGHVFAIYANGCGLSAYRVVTTGTRPALTVQWHRSGGFSTPVIANGRLYAAQDGVIRIFNPATGSSLASVTSSSPSIGGLHWEYPAVSGSLLFLPDQNGRLFAFRQG